LSARLPTCQSTLHARHPQFIALPPLVDQTESSRPLLFDARLPVDLTAVIHRDNLTQYLANNLVHHRIKEIEKQDNKN
jgi:hypothetical protein